MSIDLSVPIWTIEHVAAALGNLSLDAARAYTYTAAFPSAKASFARNLRLREEVLAWFAGLPARPRRGAGAGAGAGEEQQPRKRTSATGTAGTPGRTASTTGTAARTPVDGTRRTKAYRPRSAA